MTEPDERRRLVAVIPCRAGSRRLYGKPLQYLDVEARLTVLEHLVAILKTTSAVGEISLAIASGEENVPFVRIAEKHGLTHSWGDEVDALGRILACGRLTCATDLLRVTSECPFLYFDALEPAWNSHRRDACDVTVVDDLPDGCGFQICRFEVLEISHKEGSNSDRTAWIGRFSRRHRDRFRIVMVPAPPDLRRRDLRLTVDYPEDLVVCRNVYDAFRDFSPLIPVERIIGFLDGSPDLKALVASFGPYRSPWEHGGPDSM